MLLPFSVAGFRELRAHRGQRERWCPNNVEVVRIKDPADLAHLCGRIGGHEHIASGRNATGAAFHHVGDEAPKLVVGYLCATYGKDRDKIYTYDSANRSLFIDTHTSRGLTAASSS